jgi:hypothetical protein
VPNLVRMAQHVPHRFLLLLYCAAALLHSVGETETDLDAEPSDDEFNCSEIPQII